MRRCGKESIIVLTALDQPEARALQAAGDPRAPLYTPPDAGERFSYVIATVGCTFDLHGRKAAPSKGERMAFARVARAPDSGVEVDVAYYMMQYVAGLCARFVNSEPGFAAAGAEALTRGDETRADELSQKAAKKAAPAAPPAPAALRQTAFP